MGLFDGDFDMINFDSTTRIESKQLLSKNKRKSMLIQREQCISDLLPNISDGEQLYIVSNENFGSIELLSALTSKMKCQEIYITTWSYNLDFISLIESLLSNGVYICFNCDKSIRTRKASYWAQLADLGYKYKKQFKVKLHDLIHSKVTLIKSDTGYYSIEASANYSKNTRIEQFAITNEQDRYEFNKSWITMI